MHEWLSKPSSVLRGLLSFLSAGGVYYSASCAEKTGRAFVEHGGGHVEHFAFVAKARLCSKKEAARAKGPDDTSSLFD